MIILDTKDGREEGEGGREKKRAREPRETLRRLNWHLQTLRRNDCTHHHVVSLNLHLLRSQFIALQLQPAERKERNVKRMREHTGVFLNLTQASDSHRASERGWRNREEAGDRKRENAYVANRISVVGRERERETKEEERGGEIKEKRKKKEAEETARPSSGERSFYPCAACS